MVGPYAHSHWELEQYGITPTAAIKLGVDWQAKATFNYGRSKTSVHTPLVNAAALAAAGAGTTIATALNPYDLTQTNAGVIGGSPTSRTTAATSSRRPSTG